MDSLIYWISLLAKVLIFLFLLRYVVTHVQWQWLYCSWQSWSHRRVYIHTPTRIGVWGLFWLVRKALKIDISLHGWRVRGFESLSIKTSNLELVRFMNTCTMTGYSMSCVPRKWLCWEYMCRASRDGVRVLQHGDCINACTHVHVLYNVYGSSYMYFSKWTMSSYLCGGLTPLAVTSSKSILMASTLSTTPARRPLPLLVLVAVDQQGILRPVANPQAKVGTSCGTVWVDNLKVKVKAICCRTMTHIHRSSAPACELCKVAWITSTCRCTVLYLQKSSTWGKGVIVNVHSHLSVQYSPLKKEAAALLVCVQSS